MMTACVTYIELGYHWQGTRKSTRRKLSIGNDPGQLNGQQYDVDVDMNFMIILIVLWQNTPMNQHMNTFIKFGYKARMIKRDYPVTFALFQYADRLSSVASML